MGRNFLSFLAFFLIAIFFAILTATVLFLLLHFSVPGAQAFSDMKDLLGGGAEIPLVAAKTVGYLLASWLISSGVIIMAFVHIDEAPENSLTLRLLNTLADLFVRLPAIMVGLLSFTFLFLVLSLRWTTATQILWFTFMIVPTHFVLSRSAWQSSLGMVKGVRLVLVAGCWGVCRAVMELALFVWLSLNLALLPAAVLLEFKVDSDCAGYLNALCRFFLDPEQLSGLLFFILLSFVVLNALINWCIRLWVKKQ